MSPQGQGCLPVSSLFRAIRRKTPNAGFGAQTRAARAPVRRAGPVPTRNESSEPVAHVSDRSVAKGLQLELIRSRPLAPFVAMPEMLRSQRPWLLVRPGAPIS